MAKTRKDYEEEAILKNWATAQPGNYYSTGSGMQQYTGWNGGSVTGADMMAATSDANRYGYDVWLDPRNGTRDMIAGLLQDVNIRANDDAVKGVGDYDSNRQNYLNQIGWTDYQTVFKNLQETGSLGLTDLNGNDLTELALAERKSMLPGEPYEIDPAEMEALQQALAQQAQQQAYVNQYLSPLMNGNNSGQGGSQSGAWGYDQNTDPVWNAILKQNTRAGEKAMNDALAQLSARTGGLASTYAGQVAQQTMGDYLQNATDYIPQLYDAAYGRWMDEQEMARAAEETAYQRQQDALDRQLAADQTAWERQMYQNELAADERSQGLDLLLSMMGIGYQPTSEELSRYGLNQGMADAVYGDYLSGITPKTSGGGSAGSSISRKDIIAQIEDYGWQPTAEEMQKYGISQELVDSILSSRGTQESAGYDEIAQKAATFTDNESLDRYLSGLVTNGLLSETEAQRLYLTYMSETEEEEEDISFWNKILGVFR